MKTPTYHRIQIVSEHPCPSCNATGTIALLKRKPTSHFWEHMFRCPKCGLRAPVPGPDGAGFLLSDKNKRILDGRRALQRAYDKAKTPAARGRIMAALRAIDESEKEWIESL